MGWTGKVKSNQEVKLCLSVVQRYVRLTTLNMKTDEVGLYGYMLNISLLKQKPFLCVSSFRVQTEYRYERTPETKSLDFI